jgi:hypothetical protein
MKNPAAFLHRTSISDELGHSSVRSQSLRFLARLAKLCLKEELDVIIHHFWSNLMEFEYFCDGSKQLKTKTRADPRFWTTSDKELDVRDFIHITGEHREDGRCRFFILALIKGINDDEGWNGGSTEWANDDILQLGTKGLMSNSRVGPQDLEQLLSEQGIPICKLECKCWENPLNIASVLKIS